MSNVLKVSKQLHIGLVYKLTYGISFTLLCLLGKFLFTLITNMLTQWQFIKGPYQKIVHHTELWYEPLLSFPIWDIRIWEGRREWHVSQTIYFRLLQTFTVVYPATDHPADGGSRHLWNVGQFLPDYMTEDPRRKSSSYSSLWEPQISLVLRSSLTY
jgi:hypothetical protein